MTPVRLALIGYGKWGRNYVTAARESGEAEVTRIVKRGEAIPQDVDAVVIATHPSAAPELCEQALSAGLPVMVEKPAGLSLADAERIQRSEAESGRFVLVNHQHLFAEGFEEFRKAAKGGGCIYRSLGPVARDFDAVWDYGPHAASMALAMGPVETPQARPRLVITDPAAIDYKNGTIIAGNRSQKECSAIWFYEDEYTIEYDAYESTSEPPLTRSVRAFARAVRDGGTDDYRFGARWAVDVARILSRSDDSVYE